jgi:hypothetical protein
MNGVVMRRLGSIVREKSMELELARCRGQSRRELLLLLARGALAAAAG